MEENWRDVPGYEGLYQISIDTPEGRCRSLNYHSTGKTKLLSNKVNKRDNRIYWHLYKKGKYMHWQAARWIALTYPELVENDYFEGAHIDHKDTDRLNNRPSNLRWVTQKENNNNPLTRKHSSETHTEILKNHPSTSKRVFQYTTDGEYVNDYPSISEGGRQTGIQKANISKCCLGKAKYAGKKDGEKYIWKYIN